MSQLRTTFSRSFVQENGVPQGGVLSVTLFLIKMNSIVKSIPQSLSYSLYVDDLQISCCSCNISVCERQLQLGINSLTRWADANGFSFSPEKSVCVHFSLRRGMTLEPSLILRGQAIPVHNEHKFLGVIFDEKIDFQ